MYFFAIAAMLLSLPLFLWCGSTTASPATALRPLTATSPLLPSYPPGDLELYHFPGNQPGNVAFTPDGSAYSLVRDGLLRIAPDGTKSFVGGASIYGGGSIDNRIVYSNGFLWYQVHQGLLRGHPDGTDPRYLQLPSALGQRQLNNFTAGGDGVYYTYYNTTTSPSGVALEGPVLASISSSFVKTEYPLVAPTPILRDGYYYGPSVGAIVYHHRNGRNNGPRRSGRRERLRFIPPPESLPRPQNIYFFGAYPSNQLYFGEYVRHQLSFTPSVVGLLYSDAAEDVYVSEPVKSGPWTAVSLNPAIATATPSLSTVGRFSVTEIGHGSTSIKVTDVYGNVEYLPVTAN
jgi:hypothetical protein